MKALFLPLDERPCNYLYPQWVPIDDVELLLPPRKILPQQKKIGDVDAIGRWVKDNCDDVDYVLISLDMLLYSGIVPSRLHHDSVEEIEKRLEVLHEIKKRNPRAKIFVHSLIMRTPSYNLATEEPDYVGECGLNLYIEGVYLDKEKQGLLTEEDKAAREENRKKFKQEYLDDLLTRRKTNKEVILKALQYYIDGTIDFFLIPQDDCAPFGFTSMDRREIVQFLVDNHIDDKVVMHPGADEAGLTLLARAINDSRGKFPKFYVAYNCDESKHGIPEFESQHLDITMTSQIESTLSKCVDAWEEADIILVVSAGKNFMNCHLPEWPDSFAGRDIPRAIGYIEKAIHEGKVVAVADLTYCNRGDIDLYDAIVENELLFEISSYAGWNTSSNTLGTTIANAVGYFHSHDDEKKNVCLAHRYIEDILYMAKVRDELNAKVESHPDWKISIHALDGMKNMLQEYVKERLTALSYGTGLLNCVPGKKIDVRFIWNRTFEAEVTFK